MTARSEDGGATRNSGAASTGPETHRTAVRRDHMARVASSYMERRWLKSSVTRWDHERTRQTLLDELKLAPTDRCLEIGCGTGAWTKEVASRAREVVAVDISASMLAEARRYTEGLPVQYAHSDFMDYEPTGTFDRVLSLRAIEYIKDKDSLARKIAQVVAPGGTVVLITKTRASIWRGRMRLLYWKPSFMRGRGKESQGRPDDDEAPRTRQYLVSPGQLARVFRPYGLELVRVRPVVVRLPLFRHGFHEIPVIPDWAAPRILPLFSYLYKLGSATPRWLSFLPLLLSESYSVTFERRAASDPP